jgi:hypothetical protein
MEEVECEGVRVAGRWGKPVKSNQGPGRRERALSRRIEAFELRKCGASYRQIGRALGISEAQAHRDVADRVRQVEKIEEECAQQVRRIELGRLDACTAGLWPGIESGEHTAVNSLMRVMARRAAMLGLDAPRMSQPSGKDGGQGQTDATLDYSRLDSEQLAQLDRLLTLAARPQGTQTGD